MRRRWPAGEPQYLQGPLEAQDLEAYHFAFGRGWGVVGVGFTLPLFYFLFRRFRTRFLVAPLVAWGSDQAPDSECVKEDPGQCSSSDQPCRIDPVLKKQNTG